MPQEAPPSSPLLGQYTVDYNLYSEYTESDHSWDADGDDDGHLNSLPDGSPGVVRPATTGKSGDIHESKVDAESGLAPLYVQSIPRGNRTQYLGFDAVPSDIGATSRCNSIFVFQMSKAF